jgi:hypothetical protein
MVNFALSIKQPWATLLVHGLKSIEVRSWPTRQRGRVWIHAARVADPGERGWLLVPAGLRQAAERTGGIIGAGTLTDCLAYRTRQSFAADVDRHCNDPAWFRAPVLYGFVFERVETVPFHPCSGWIRFFTVPDRPRRKRRVGQP